MKMTDTVRLAGTWKQAMIFDLEIRKNSQKLSDDKRLLFYELVILRQGPYI